MGGKEEKRGKKWTRDNNFVSPLLFNYTRATNSPMICPLTKKKRWRQKPKEEEFTSSSSSSSLQLLPLR